MATAFPWFYELSTPGDPPISLDEIKECLKLPAGSHPEDDLIQVLLNAAVESAEKWTQRETTANVWFLFLDSFTGEVPITLRRDPVDVSVPIVVDYWPEDGTDWSSTVDDSNYYLKRLPYFTEVHLAEDGEWPDDVETCRLQTVRITFTTKPALCLDTLKAGIKRHVSFMFQNRGDCDPAHAIDSTEASGAAALYDIGATIPKF